MLKNRELMIRNDSILSINLELVKKKEKNADVITLAKKNRENSKGKKENRKTINLQESDRKTN